MMDQYFSIGDYELLFLDDGSFDYPAGLFSFGVANEQAGDSSETISVPYKALHLKGNNRQIIVDTGAGPLGPKTGKFLESIRANKIDLGGIDTVILTHAHPDHIGGLYKVNGSVSFPNASILISRSEWEFWLSQTTSGKLGMGEIMGVSHLEKIAKQWLESYLFPLSNRVKLIDREIELCPGIRLLQTPGHSPGHLCIQINSGMKSFIYLSDLVLSSEQIRNPELTTIFDFDSEVLHASRLAIFERAVKQESLMACCHINGVWQVSLNDVGYEWIDARENSGS